MSTELKITHENAESIGRPIFDKIIQSFLNSDHEGLIQFFPELQQWMTPESYEKKIEIGKTIFGVAGGS